MTVKRISDPAMILPDKINITIDGCDEENTNSTLKAMMAAHSPRARIERLGRHEILCDLRDELFSQLQEGNADIFLLELIAQAESKALYLDVLPKVDRVNKWQESVEKPRGSRWKALDVWLDKQPLDLTIQEIFDRLPHSFDAESQDASFYRDGDIVCSNANNIYKDMTMNGFSKRVSKARKRKKLSPR